MTPISVGLAGLGRSGWEIHGGTLARCGHLYKVAAVTDERPERRAEAQTRFGCQAYPTFEQLIADPKVELVVVATPSHLHARQVIAALKADKHVVCEKPMALSAADAQEMVAAAARSKRILTIFQNRRFDPHFQEVQRIVSSGVLGRLVEVRFNYSSFARRWDWQTLKEFGGGSLNNVGSHFLDQLLWFFPNSVPQVHCHMDRALTLGDAEDHFTMMLQSPGCPLVMLQVSSACGYPIDNWLIMGTGGTLRGTLEELHWRVASFGELPVKTAERTPTPDRSYNSDRITWAEHHWRVAPERAPVQYIHQRFYESLFETIRNGAPLVVTPEQVLKQLRVLDACRAAAELHPA